MAFAVIYMAIAFLAFGWLCWKQLYFCGAIAMCGMGMLGIMFALIVDSIAEFGKR